MTAVTEHYKLLLFKVSSKSCVLIVSVQIRWTCGAETPPTPEWRTSEGWAVVFHYRSRSCLLMKPLCFFFCSLSLSDITINRKWRVTSWVQCGWSPSPSCPLVMETWCHTPTAGKECVCWRESWCVYVKFSSRTVYTAGKLYHKQPASGEQSVDQKIIRWKSYIWYLTMFQLSCVRVNDSLFFIKTDSDKIEVKDKEKSICPCHVQQD